jgi:hypothetical protein
MIKHVLLEKDKNAYWLWTGERLNKSKAGEIIASWGWFGNEWVDVYIDPPTLKTHLFLYEKVRVSFKYIDSSILSLLTSDSVLVRRLGVYLSKHYKRDYKSYMCNGKDLYKIFTSTK